jgi:hypothetical protein
MGDARSEVPLAVLQDRQGSTAPTLRPPADAGSGDTGQQEVSSPALRPYLSSCLPLFVSCCMQYACMYRRR